MNSLSSGLELLNNTNTIGIPLLIGLFIAMFLLIMLSALFSSSETALLSVRVSEVKEIVKNSKGRKKTNAKNILFLLNDFNGTISAILIANNLVNIINTSLVTFVFTALFGAAGVVYGTIMMTILIVIFSEIIPKIFSKRHAISVSLKVSGIIKMIYYATYPVNALFRKIVKDDEYLTVNSSKILLQQISHFKEEGTLSKDKTNWLKNVLKLESAKASDVMIPIEKVRYIHQDFSDKQVMELFRFTQLSRFPVLTKDGKKVISMLNIKDYFAEMVIDKNKKLNWKKFTYQPITFSRTTRLDDILDVLQEQRKYFAIVTKTKNDPMVVGIITIEDIMEEIIGEVYDENDSLEDDVHPIGLDTIIVYETTIARVLFVKYLKNVKTPAKLSSNLEFGDWMKKYFHIAIFEEGKHYSYENISIWIKKHNDSQKVMFEIDIHEKS